MLLALRINVLAKGYSGISLETLQQVIEAFNGRMISRVCYTFIVFSAKVSFLGGMKLSSFVSKKIPN